MEGLHKLLKRQLKKYLGTIEIPDYLKILILSIDEAYKQGDAANKMLERSLELSSKELSETIDQLKITQIQLLEREKQIKRIAYYDALTDLPNRYMLKDFITNLPSADNKFINNYAVIFIDLDNFKKINDSFGHSIGDFTLLKAAQKLEDCISPSDKVFRYGGDEFVIILNNSNYDKIILITTKIINLFKAPFIYNDYEIFMTLSIGISVFPKDGDTIEVLIKNADAAMYSVKGMSKNSFEFYSKEIESSSKRKSDLENDLRKSIQNNELFLLYQPQINLESGKIYGVKSIIYWRHPTLGVIDPSEFIPIAEEINFIIPIGEWALKNACIQSKFLQGKCLIDVSVSVNASVIQLKDSNFIEIVTTYLKSTQLSPNNLVIEFTESIMKDSQNSFKSINELRALGIRVAIQDFAIGYSSLTLIKNINIDILKIDSYFIRDIVDNPKTVTIINSIIEISNKLNFCIIIDGIETQQQYSILNENGCRVGQGPLISFPLSSKDLEAYINCHK